MFERMLPVFDAFQLHNSPQRMPLAKESPERPQFRQRGPRTPRTMTSERGPDGLPERQRLSGARSEGESQAPERGSEREVWVVGQEARGRTGLDMFVTRVSAEGQGGRGAERGQHPGGGLLDRERAVGDDMFVTRVSAEVGGGGARRGGGGRMCGRLDWTDSDSV